MSSSGLSVVVCCYNEEANLARMHREVTRALAGFDLELVLVDDGSTDGTLAEMKRLAQADPRVRYLSLTRNGGIEAALSVGFRYASKPWAAQIDCDLQFPVEEIPRMLEAAAQGYDVVFGVRTDRQDAWWRRAGSTFQQWLARRLFGVTVPEGASSFKVVRTGVARTIAEMRLGMPYFLATVPRIGARYTTVPVSHRAREDGRSRFRLSRMIGHSFELWYGHSWRPLHGMYLIAALVTVAALPVAALGLVGLLAVEAVAAAALLAAVTTLAAVALVGRYVQRLMLDQRRDRPYYIREANVQLRPEDRIDGGEEPVPPPVARDPLVVLGANVGQLPIYLEARRRGLPTVAVDKQTGTPSLRYATEHVQASVRDPEGVAARLAGRRIAGVVAGGGEMAIETWSELTERLGTRYRYPRSAAAASRDKAVFHRIAEAAGLGSYRWRHGTDPQELARQAEELGFPLVVKPADSSGKKGISLVREPGELPAALELATRHSLGGGVLLEEYLTGRDLTVDVFMRDGEVAFSAVHEKLDPPREGLFLVSGHVTPAAVDDDAQQALVAAAGRMCREIGLTDGPADFDVFLDPDGRFHLVEINARLPGQAVPYLLDDVYGVDITAALVSLVTGEEVSLAPRPDAPPTGTVGILHMLTSPLPTHGRLVGVTGLSEARRVPGVIRCDLSAEPGTVVPPFPILGHDVGYLIVTGPDRAAAEKTLAEALALITVDLDPVAAPAGTAAVPQARSAAAAESPVPDARPA